MFKSRFAMIACSALFITGCATTSSPKNYEADMNMLNSKVATLEGQIAAKDQEIARLNMRADQEAAAHNESENERRLLSQKIDSMNANVEAKNRELEEAKAREAENAKAMAKKQAEDSSLK